MYLLIFTFWIILNGKLTAEVCLLGIGITVLLGLLMRVLLFYTPKREWRIWKKVPLFVCYVFILLWEILKANVTMFGFILQEKRTIEPTLVTFRTSLKTSFGRYMLANSITLTPGTITVKLQGDCLTVHCLKRSMLDTTENSVFARWIRRLEA